MLTELADLHRDANGVGRLAILVLMEGGAGVELAFAVLVLSVRRVPMVEVEVEMKMEKEVDVVADDVADDGQDEGPVGGVQSSKKHVHGAPSS